MITTDYRSKQVVAKISRSDREAVKAVRGSMFDSGHDLIKSANTAVLKEFKTGKTYVVKTRGGMRKRHRASGPGQSHANLSGRLRKTLQFQLHGTKTIEFGYGASKRDAPDYAEFVEGGTSRMGARPTLNNALDRESATIENNFSRGFDKVYQ